MALSISGLLVGERHSGDEERSAPLLGAADLLASSPCYVTTTYPVAVSSKLHPESFSEDRGCSSVSKATSGDCLALLSLRTALCDVSLPLLRLARRGGVDVKGIEGLQ